MCQNPEILHLNAGELSQPYFMNLHYMCRNLPLSLFLSFVTGAAETEVMVSVLCIVPLFPF